MVDLCLEHYYITSIFWRSQPGAPVDDVGFGTSDEEQNEAFETIQELLTYEEDEEETEDNGSEEMRAKVPGPKRMEVELEQKGSPTVKRHVVVTEIFPPTGQFKYWSMSGRLKVSTTGKFESFMTRGMNSHEWKIAKVDTYAGGYSHLKTVFYSSDLRQDEAWRDIEKFYKPMHMAEKKVIENWTSTALNVLDDDEDEAYLYGGYGGGGYHGTHYYNRTPSAYQPVVGFARVAGDEIGAKIYLEQMESLVQNDEDTYHYDGQTLQEYLEIMEASEKKETAEEEAEQSSAATGETSTGATSEGGGGTGSARGNGASASCSDCGSPVCEGCIEGHGIAGDGAWQNAPGYLQLSAGGRKPTIH